MNGSTYEFEWDAKKADTNFRKHGVSFRLAASIFADPFLLTVADIEHSDLEERWFAIGVAGNGVPLSVVYLWRDADGEQARIRLISARNATPAEARQYKETL